MPFLRPKIRALADLEPARLVAEVAVAASALFAPAALGSANVWAVAVLLGLATLALGAVTLDAFRRGRRLVGTLALAALVLNAAIVGLQCLPLPPALIAHLAPATDDLLRFTLGPRGLYPAWRPLSLDPPATAVELGKALTYLALFGAACQLARSKEGRIRLIVVIASIGAALAMVAYLHQLFGMDALFGVESLRRPHLVTPFVNGNHLASALELSALVQLGLAVRTRDVRRAFAWGLAFLFTGSAVLLSGSRAGAVSFLAAGLVFVALVWVRGQQREPNLLRHRVALGLCFGAGVVGVAIFLNADLLLEQLGSMRDIGETHSLPRIWPQVVPLVREHWLTGIGRGAFKVVFPGYQHTDLGVTFTHPENVVLQVTSEYGLVLGLGLLVLLAGCWAEVARRSDLSAGESGVLAGLFAVGLHEFADFGLEIAGVAVPALIALAVVTVRPTSRRRIPALAGAVALLGVPLLGAWGLAQSRHDVEADREELTRRIAQGAGDAELTDAAWTAMARHPADYVLALDAALAAERARPPQPDHVLYWAGRAMYLAPPIGWPHRLAADALFLIGRSSQALIEVRLALPTFAGDPTFAAELRHFLRTPEQYASLAGSTPEGVGQVLQLTAFDPKLSLQAGELAMASVNLEVPSLLLELASRASQAGDHAKALAYGRRALEARPEDVEAYRRIAAEQRALGQADAAELTLREALHASPGNLRLSVDLADLLGAKKSFDEAHRLLRTSIAPNASERAAVLGFDAQLWRAQGLDTNAISALREAASLVPDNPDRQYALASLFQQLNRPREAMAAIDRGLAMDRTGSRDERMKWRAQLQEQVKAQDREGLLHELKLEDDPRLKGP